MADLLEPKVEPTSKFVDFVETLAREIEECPQFDMSVDFGPPASSRWTCTGRSCWPRGSGTSGGRMSLLACPPWIVVEGNLNAPVLPWLLGTIPNLFMILALMRHLCCIIFLSRITIEEEMRSNTTMVLLERLVECATDGWEKQLAYHQLGVVMLERKEYKDSQHWFEATVEAGKDLCIVLGRRKRWT